MSIQLTHSHPYGSLRRAGIRTRIAPRPRFSEIDRLAIGPTYSMLLLGIKKNILHIYIF